MTDIGVVRGLIELQDDFTSEIGLAKAALSNFSKENQESLKAVAGAAGLVAAAIGTIAVSTLALGNRGADINDLTGTLEHFAGGAEAANAAMDALRAGTLGTVDNFILAKDAAHLLSAGVKLTADDFGTLGSAAFILQNRGLGGTKEMLDLVSDAMVTGRTRALAMALGVVDTGDAEAEYAKKLGVTKDQLSDTGKVEAKRIAVLELLNRAVKDAGVQERDFGEQLEYSRTVIENWIDDLASAVASSKVLEDGLQKVTEIVTEAFGGDTTASIDAVVEAIESAAIVGVNFGLGAIEMARVVHTAWSAIKTGILAAETIVVDVANIMAAGLTLVAKAANSLHLIPDSAVTQVEEARTVLQAMTSDLAKQADEAERGIYGHSEFDKTLDELGGTLYRVKDAMTAASNETKEGTEVAKVAKANADKLAETQKQLTASMIDRAKVEAELWKVEEKSLKETSELWNEYFNLRAHGNGTSMDAARSDIQKWFDDEVGKLDSSDRNWQNHYDALAAISKEKLAQVGSNWDDVKDKSFEALNQMAEKERQTLNDMIYSGLHFSQQAIEAQRQKFEDAKMEARGMGKEFVTAQNAAREAALEHTHQLEEVEKAARRAREEARALGGSFEVTKANIESTAAGMGVDPEAVTAWAKLGYSFQHAVDFARKMGLPPAGTPEGPGPRIPGFAEGGTVMVGENGPEVVRLPLGATVFPNGMKAPEGYGGGSITNHIYINDTLQNAARKVTEEIVRTASRGRLFGGSK